MPDPVNSLPFEDLKVQLKLVGQEHLVEAYQNINDTSKKEYFLEQLRNLPLGILKNLTAVNPTTGNEHPGEISPLAPLDVNRMDSALKEKWLTHGKTLLANSEVACFLVAGGQGTRLGHPGPKGTFDISLASGKSLFELQAQRIKKLEHQENSTLPWYIMTSPENHLDTITFFAKHNYFGLSKENIFFFNQGTLPLVDDKGKILLASQTKLATGPDGNGGCFKALADSGALADMQKRGIKYVFFHNIDNALVNMADPLFIGATAFNKHPIGSKVVAKKNPEEKVGLLLNQGGRPCVLEYSDLSESLLHDKNAKGELTYNNGSIGIHVFSLEFLLKHASSPLPYHRAHKKVPTLDNPAPEVPNAWKFEMFMFDVFPLADNITALMVNREEEFAPVKNKQGNDSPATAKALLLNHYKKTGDSSLI